jgi:hypothetical protein
VRSAGPGLSHSRMLHQLMTSLTNAVVASPDINTAISIEVIILSLTLDEARALAIRLKTQPPPIKLEVLDSKVRND